jgi:hypothetical protein
MSKQRKQYSAAFKSKVALEAIKGVRSANEMRSPPTMACIPPRLGSGRNRHSSICGKRLAMAANELSERKQSCKTNFTSKSGNSK